MKINQQDWQRGVAVKLDEDRYVALHRSIDAEANCNGARITFCSMDGAQELLTRIAISKEAAQALAFLLVQAGLIPTEMPVSGGMKEDPGQDAVTLP